MLVKIKAASGQQRRAASSRLSVPLALTVKSVIGSRAAQSSDTARPMLKNSGTSQENREAISSMVLPAGNNMIGNPRTQASSPAPPRAMEGEATAELANSYQASGQDRRGRRKSRRFCPARTNRLFRAADFHRMLSAARRKNQNEWERWCPLPSPHQGSNCLIIVILLLFRNRCTNNYTNKLRSAH